MFRWWLPLLAVALTGAALPPVQALPEDVLRDRIIEKAAAINPSELAFERVTMVLRKGGGSKTEKRLVERWDGERWSLLSVNGHAPSRAEKAAAASDNSVPGYHQLARIIAASTERQVTPDGRTLLVVPMLPEKSVVADGKDISRHLCAEALLGLRDGQPWVERLTVKEREPFKLNLLIKVTSFEQVNDYRLGTDGQPRLVAQVNGSVGTMFGITGGETSEVIYAYR